MNYEYLLLEKKEGIATITLNRPDKLNALIPQMRAEMRMALEDVATDDSIRVVILTGAGRGFCAGADVVTVVERTEMGEDAPPPTLLSPPSISPLLLALIRSLNKPTICALNGVAAGAGTLLALTCDIVIASEQARFRISFTRLGLPPSEGLSYLLPRRIGTHRTLELVYTNDIIDAKEMERIGLVNRIVPHDELMKAAKEMAKKMFQIPPITLALSKQCIYKGITAPDIESQMIFERLVRETLWRTEDHSEAQRSFIEKREPVYKGK